MRVFILSISFCFLSNCVVAQFTNFVGVGALFSLDSSQEYKAAKVTVLLPGAVADKAGVKPGDLILKVNDKTAINLTVDEVKALMKGTEGTIVKLEVNQAGVTKTFTMVLKSTVASPIINNPAVNSDFCDAFARLLNDAAFEFIHIIDSTSPGKQARGFEEDEYPLNFKFPDVKKAAILKGMGTTGRIAVGTYNNLEEVNKAGEKIISQLKTCFPDFYFSFEPGKDINKMHIGKDYPKGYTGPYMEMYSYQDEDSKAFEMVIQVDGSLPPRFNTIYSEKTKNDFGKAIHKVYDAAATDFASIKTKQYVGTGMVNRSIAYDVNFSLPGSVKSMINGGSTMERKDQYISYFYLGNSRSEAVAIYQKMGGEIRDCFGSEFVLTFFRPSQLWVKHLPDNPEEMALFAKKKKKISEPVTISAFVFNKEKDGRYSVSLRFYNADL